MVACTPYNIKKGGDDLYEKFQKLLDENGTTAYTVAKTLDITTSVLYEWKRGKRECPNAETMNKICNFFHVPLNYFFDNK